MVFLICLLKKFRSYSFFFTCLVDFFGGGCEKGMLKISTIILANYLAQWPLIIIKFETIICLLTALKFCELSQLKWILWIVFVILTI